VQEMTSSNIASTRPIPKKLEKAPSTFVHAQSEQEIVSTKVEADEMTLPFTNTSGPTKKKVLIPAIFGQPTHQDEVREEPLNTIRPKKKISIPSIFGQPPEEPAVKQENTSTGANETVSLEQNVDVVPSSSLVAKRKVKIPSIFAKPHNDRVPDKPSIQRNVPNPPKYQPSLEKEPVKETSNAVPLKKKVSIPSIFGQQSSENATKAENTPVRKEFIVEPKSKFSSAIAVDSVNDDTNHNPVVHGTPKTTLNKGNVENPTINKLPVNENPTTNKLPVRKKVSIPSIFGQSQPKETDDNIPPPPARPRTNDRKVVIPSKFGGH
jgi:hypothetical protein